MADEKVTTSLNVDITQFKTALTEANRYIRLANSEFENATAGTEKWSDSADGLKAKITQLNKTLEGQEVAAAALRTEYARVVAEQGENSKGAQELAIKLNKQEAACKKTAAQIQKYEGDLEDVESASEDTEESTLNMSDAFGKAATAAGTLATGLVKIAGKTIINSIKGIATAAAGLVTAFLATGETSKEWISNMNKLDAVAQETGRSTEAVRGQFKEFYGILGDETAATTTVNNLEAVGLSQENLASVTNSMAGIWASYGDSIPLDGLAEAINETSRCGTVTGNLADALNWAGINEDQFNEKLAACTTEEQRQQLIVDALDSAYGQLGQTYKEQNAAIIESNQATAALNDALAGVGEASMPVVSALKNMGAAILTDMLPNIQTLGTSFRDALTGSKEAAAEMGGAVSSLLQGIGQKIVQALPTIITIGTSIITSLVQGLVTATPALAEGVTQIVQYFIQAAPQLLAAGASMISSLVGAIRQNLPQLLKAGGDMLYQLLDGIVSNLPAMAQGALDSIGSFVQGIQKNLPVILSKGSELLGKLGEGIRTALPNLVSQALDIIMNFATTLYDNAPTLIATGFDLLSDLVSGIISAIPDLLAKGPEIISKFANIINDNFPTILKKGAELLWQIITGLISVIPDLITNAGSILTAIVDVFEAFNWLNLGKSIITFFKNGITSMVGAVKGAGQNVFDGVMNTIKSLPEKLLNLGKNALTYLKNAITGGQGGVTTAGKNIFNAIVNAIKSLPSKLLGMGQDAVVKLAGALSPSSIKSKAVEIVTNVINAFKDLPSKMTGIGKEVINGVISGIGAQVGKLYDSIKNALSGLVKKAKSALGIASPSKVFADSIGQWIPAGIADGIEDNTKTAVRSMTNSTKSILGAANSEMENTSLQAPGVNGTGTGGGTGAAGGVTYNFYQTNNSPKSLSRAEIYRQTKNQLLFATSNG